MRLVQKSFYSFKEVLLFYTKTLLSPKITVSFERNVLKKISTFLSVY